MKEKLASYDVTISPKVNVLVKVEDPYKPTEKEIETIIDAAICRIHETSVDVLVSDNLESIELYSTGDKLNDVLPTPVPIVPKLKAIDELQAARIALEKIVRSGYIPFASPSPSTTEKFIKQAILSAITDVNDAISYHERVYGKK